MTQPKQLPPIVYSNKIKLFLDVDQENKEKKTKYLDEIASTQFLKNYFSLKKSRSINSTSSKYSKKYF